MVKIVDVRRSEAASDARYDVLVELAKEIFGEDNVNYHGNGHTSSERSSIYIPKKFDNDGVAIDTEEREVVVSNKSYYDKALDFAERYEETFGQDVVLRKRF